MPITMAVITRDNSDLSDLLCRVRELSVTVLSPDRLTDEALQGFSCACVLGGTQTEPLILPARSRTALENFAQSGKRVFCEYMQSFALNYCKPAESTRFLRLKCVATDFAGLPQGTLLDDQRNRRAAPYYHARDARPLLVYKSGMTNHAAEDVTETERQDFTQYALWLETPQMMVCCFSLCNFLRARFAPQTCWRQVIQGVLNWLAGTALPLPDRQPCYRLQPRPTLRDCARAGMEWFEKADMLLQGGYAGVREGLATEIYPDGRQETAKPVRTDCAGEAAMAYFFHALATDDADGLEKSRLLEDFVYNVMQIHDGAYRGMLRWTDAAWGVCYQDDAARAMLVTLFRALYGQGREHLADCRSALEFLLNTTGPDGLRPARTDLLNMTHEDFRKLGTENADFPCAHYNAFYLGCLLLYGKLTGDERCLTVGECGMRSIWRAYPHTVREQSETEELCRLLLPTAWLYYATGKAEDKALLYTLVHDLEKMRHPSGGYLEWDSDYSAACSRQDGGECSLLSRNGDPVVDLLYSNNWVPLGLMQAYFVTGDEEFYRLFCRHADFLRRCQIRSGDPKLDGAWARGYDVDKMEVFGLPNDVGWGPWAIESGWTVAEITAGLYAGILKDELKEYYR